jgi:hypothetical protein
MGRRLGLGVASIRLSSNNTLIYESRHQVIASQVFLSESLVGCLNASTTDKSNVELTKRLYS